MTVSITSFGFHGQRFAQAFVTAGGFVGLEALAYRPSRAGRAVRA